MVSVYICTADDTQLYVSFDVAECGYTIVRVEECVGDIQSLMLQNKLQLNGNKTEMIVFTSPYIKNHNSDVQLLICEDLIKSSKFARNLGAVFDKHLNLEAHVATICRSSYFHIQNIRSLRPILNRDALISVFHPFISSRLDYCNSLLYGISDKSIQKLQCIQNIAARLVSGCKKFDHITPIIKDLHWLSIQERITVKVLIMTCKAIK